MTARYVVEVNECGIFASRIGVDWWTRNILMRPVADRLMWLFIGPGGGLAQLPCVDKEEAEFVRDQMVGGGIHRKHVTVKRVKAAVS